MNMDFNVWTTFDTACNYCSSVYARKVISVPGWQGGQSVRDHIETGNTGKMLTVSYRTFLGYMSLAVIILHYPRLILCDLTFSQILKQTHELRTQGRGIEASLSFSVQLKVQNKTIVIDHYDVKTMEVSFTTDPDWVFHDCPSLIKLNCLMIRRCKVGWVRRLQRVATLMKKET